MAVGGAATLPGRTPAADRPAVGRARRRRPPLDEDERPVPAGARSRHRAGRCSRPRRHRRAGPHRSIAAGNARSCPRRLPDRRGASAGARVRRDLRGPRGPRARRARADHRPADLAAARPATDCSPSRRCPTSTATTSSTPRQYTETNAAFHDYLFTLTGNEHLLQAYQALGVKGRMQRGAAQRDLVPSAVRPGPRRHRRGVRGRRPRRRPRR